MAVPVLVKASMDAYVNQKMLPGSFLMAVLCNDLTKSVGYADSTNLAALPDIVRYVYNELPGNCWGNEDKVYKWVANSLYAVK